MIEQRRKAVCEYAHKRGSRVYYHPKSQTWQIDGHRWDRWAELKDKPDPTMVPGSNNFYVRGLHS